MRRGIQHEGAALRQVQDSSSGRPARYVVIRRGVEIGFIEKFANDRETIHPWKAFHGIGHAARFLGVSYAKDGKQRAINAVVSNTELKD